MQENMSKAAGSKGSNAAPKSGGQTQNISPLSPQMSRMRALESSSMNVPGDGNVARACGAVTEGSARAYADAMDAVTGSVSAPVREASDGNNQ